MVRKERRAFTFLLILGQYLKMANSDKSNNTTIGKNILIIAKKNLFRSYKIFSLTKDSCSFREILTSFRIAYV